MLICQQMLMHYRAVTDAEDMTSAVSGEDTNLLLLLYYHKKESFKDYVLYLSPHLCQGILTCMLSLLWM